MTRIRIFDPPNIFRGDLKGLESKDFILSRCAVYFFSLWTEELIYNCIKKPTKWPPIWTFAIRLRLFIYRGKGSILLHIIEIYFVVHRTALRFSQSDTRNLSFRLIEVWMSYSSENFDRSWTSLHTRKNKVSSILLSFNDDPKSLPFGEG